MHEVESPFSAGKTTIRVLPPDDLKPAVHYTAIYVLPVEAGNQERYGDGLLEIKKRGLHNTNQAVFVAPTFSHLPWYANHPTDTTIRQESHMLQVVVPFVDKNYPVWAAPKGRLLLGFSKSGWGAWSLLLRHPEVFGRAAAWDAPLMMERVGSFGSGAVFETQENFKNYQVSEALRKRAAALGEDKRLVLMGFSGFRADHLRAHALLDELRIPHDYRDGPQRPHNWHSGWVSEAVELLVGRAQRQ